MSARKAYISSLGTTGLLVAAALAMLIVVGALMAFDRWPTQAVAEAESVPVATGGADERTTAANSETRATATERGAARATKSSSARSRAALRGAAARAARVGAQTRDATPAPAGTTRDPVVSALPAPDTAPDAPAAAQSPAAAPAQGQASQPDVATPRPPVIQLPPSPVDPTAVDGLDGATTHLGDTVSVVSPQLGQTVSGTGTSVTGTITQLLER
jgi:hypothetical protein